MTDINFRYDIRCAICMEWFVSYERLDEICCECQEELDREEQKELMDGP